MSVFKAIAAVAQNGVIGCGDKIPWHISDEFRHFKRTTMGGIVAFGRRTWESLGGPLPGRENVVISSNPCAVENARAFSSLSELADFYSGDSRTLWICGGARLYKEALPVCSELILTSVKMSPEGDAFFPEYKNLFKPAETIMTHELFEVVRYVRI